MLIDFPGKFSVEPPVVCASANNAKEQVPLDNQVTELVVSELAKRKERLDSLDEPAKKLRVEQTNLTEKIKEELDVLQTVNRLLKNKYAELEEKSNEILASCISSSILNSYIEKENTNFEKYEKILKEGTPENLNKFHAQILEDNYNLNATLMAEVAKIPQPENFYGQILKDESEKRPFFRVLTVQTRTQPLTIDSNQNIETLEELENKIDLLLKDNALLKQRNQAMSDKLQECECKQEELIGLTLILKEENQQLIDKILAYFKVDERSYSQALNTHHKLSIRAAIIFNAVYNLKRSCAQILHSRTQDPAIVPVKK